MTVFTNPEDLTEAILEKVNPRRGLVTPTVEEQLIELIWTKELIEVETENSFYVLAIGTDVATLMKRRDNPSKATGTLVIVHDPHTPGRIGLRIQEPSGRTLSTSGVKSVRAIR